MTIAIFSSELSSAERIREFFRFYRAPSGFRYRHYSLAELPILDKGEAVYRLFESYEEDLCLFPAPKDLPVDTKAVVYADFADRIQHCPGVQTESVIISNSYLSLMLISQVKPDLADLQELFSTLQSGNNYPWLNLDGLPTSFLNPEHSHLDRPKLFSFLNNPEEKTLLVCSEPHVADLLIAIDPLDTSVLYPEERMPSLNLNLMSLRPEEQNQKLYVELYALEQLLQKIQSGYSDTSCFLRNSRQRKSQRISSSYSFFAEHYDAYMSHVDYQLWVDSLLYWYRNHSSGKCRRILEIACGTANLGCLFQKQGYQTEACDQSLHMLEVAQRKTIKPLLFRRSLTEDLPQKEYDLVACLFDSVNYLQSKAEIMLMLKSVHSALSESGLFIFDISTVYNSKENFADSFNLSTLEHGYLLHQAEYDDFVSKQKSYLLYFHESKTGFKLHRERHTQRVFRLYELIDIIDCSLFQLVGLYATDKPQNLIGQKNRALDEKYPRLFFVLKKK